MALTATATHEILDVVIKRVSLKEPAIVAISPNRRNIKLMIEPSQSILEFAVRLAQALKGQKENYIKTIVFCNSYSDCL